MNTATICTGLSASKPHINPHDGIIAGVSVITEGEAIGHGAYVDQKTLEAVKELGSAKPTGVKVKIEHGSGFDAVVGVIRNFALSAGKVIGDLQLLRTHERFSSILEIARTMPESVGLSIAFATTKEELNGKSYFRPTQLFSVDLVDYPAANPSGLFSALTALAKTSFGRLSTTREGWVHMSAADRETFGMENGVMTRAEWEGLNNASKSQFFKVGGKLVDSLTQPPPAPRPAAGAKTWTRAQFDVMGHSERNAFFKSGGKLTN